MRLLVTLRWAEAEAAALRGAREKCSVCRVIGVHFALKWVFSLLRNRCSLCSEICNKHLFKKHLRLGRCGAKGSRTPDLLNAIQALYQLSYGPRVVSNADGSVCVGIRRGLL